MRPNPQPVSLVDELRKLEQKWEHDTIIDGPHGKQYEKHSADCRRCELSTLLAQHAVAEPQIGPRTVMGEDGHIYELHTTSTTAHAAEQPKLTEERVREMFDAWWQRHRRWQFRTKTEESAQSLAFASWNAAILFATPVVVLTSPVAPPPPEKRDWKGVRWVDSIRASGLAEEIAKHFGHSCDNCGEDVDTDACEFAWVESKISEFLYSVGARVPTPEAPPPHVTVSTGAPAGVAPPSWAKPQWDEGAFHRAQLAESFVPDYDAPPVAPGEQPPKFLTCLSCGLPEPSCKCKRSPANENSAMGTPPAQERASDELLRQLAQQILKPLWPVVHNMEENAAREREVDRIEQVLATAAKQAREEATLAEHRSHIEFENELYATLVDPVAEGSIKEAEMRKQLLESARWYRQHVHDLEQAIRDRLTILAAQPSPQTKEDGK